MRPQNDRRRGAIVVLAAAMMVVVLAMAAFSLDVGWLALTKGQMQNAVDAAALAAAMELNPYDDQDTVEANATAVAEEIAALHRAGDHVNVGVGDNLGSVQFGRRIYNPNTGEYTYQWGPGARPYNLVKVTAARQEVPLIGQESKFDDQRLPLFFGPVIGHPKAPLETSAIATFQPRDIMIVLDYSASMNDDSEFGAIDRLGRAAIEDNIQQMWQDLGAPTYGNMGFEPDWVTIPGRPASGAVPHIKVTWKGNKVSIVSTKDLSNVVMDFGNGRHQKIEGLHGRTGTFQGSGQNSGDLIRRVWVKSGNNSSGDGPGYGEEFDFFDTDTIRKGLGLNDVPYPASGSWDDYIEYICSPYLNWYDPEVYEAGYQYKFGAMTLINYWNVHKPGHDQTPFLWKVSQQPITALKDSTDLLLDYLITVHAEDNVGLSVYTHPNGGALMEAPLGTGYVQLKTISRQRQAGHYDQYTNIGAGMRSGRLELEANSRPSAYKMMILMTDGLANRTSTKASPTQFVIDEANLAKASGIKIMTVSLGLGADGDLMQQVADITGGTHFNVPGGEGVAQYEAQLKQAFGAIAADRPFKLIDAD